MKFVSILPIPKDVFKPEIPNHITSSRSISASLAEKHFVLGKGVIILPYIYWLLTMNAALFQDSYKHHQLCGGDNYECLPYTENHNQKFKLSKIFHLLKGGALVWTQVFRFRV